MANHDKAFQEFIDKIIEDKFGPPQARIYQSAHSKFKHQGEEYVQIWKKEYKILMEQDGMPIPDKFI